MIKAVHAAPNRSRGRAMMQATAWPRARSGRSIARLATLAGFAPRPRFKVQATTTRPKVTATADGQGVVSHAGSRLLADVADRTTLTGKLAEVLAVLRKPRARHDPGRVL